MYRIIGSEELPVSRWSGGTTTQLAIWPPEAVYAERNFVWRVSSARVETEESEFTALPGIARCLMVLDGTLHLRHEGHYDVDLGRFAQDNFSGSWTTHSRGRVTDFNLMTASGEGRVQLLEAAPSSRKEVELMPVISGWGAVSEVFYFLSDGISLALPCGTVRPVTAGDVLTAQDGSRRTSRTGDGQHAGGAGPCGAGRHLSRLRYERWPGAGCVTRLRSPGFRAVSPSRRRTSHGRWHCAHTCANGA